MAIALDHRPVRRVQSTHVAGLSHFIRIVSERISSAWQSYRVERELEGMPYDLRKDIGFRSSVKTTR